MNGLLKKRSGDSFGAILKNLVIGHMIGSKNLTELCDETSKEYFLSCNSNIDRTNYSRNMNKINHNKQNTFLTRLFGNVVSTLKIGKRAKKEALQILDGSALQVTGKSFEQAQYVHDGRVNGLVWGYEVLTQMVNIGQYSFPIKFRFNDWNKKEIIKMFQVGKNKFGINRVSFDAGFRGMDFYHELSCQDFLFYTKATKNWHGSFHSFNKKTTELQEIAKKKFHRNFQYVDIPVEKKIEEGSQKGKIVKLRMIFVKNDKRIFLTNDFKSSAKKIYQYYCRRWKIEEMFKEEKQNLGFENLTVRKTNAIRTHIMTVFLAFTFCQLILKKFPTIKGIKLLIRQIIKQTAEITKTTKGITIKFIKKFKHQTTIEKLT